MGWKASTIIINNPTPIDSETLLKELGFNSLTKTKEELFEAVMNPSDNEVYIGSYKDNLLICAPDIPMHFFENNESQTEKALNRIFPNAEICSIVLHSVVNLWGYSVIKNGKKIRTRAGSADGGTFIELGEPLDEEKELLSMSTLDKNGNRIYLLDRFPDEPFSEDQVGENFVFAICKRYFDEELDSADELLFKTTLTGYKYGKIKQGETQRTPQVQTIKTEDKKPWWKFW